MDAFDLETVVAEQLSSGRPYHEFFRVTDLSLGIYTIPTGGVDPQQPHKEDEIYVVASGRGTISIAGEDRELSQGAIVYVAKHVEHHFHSVTEDLSLLVFFAPAQS